MNQKDEIAALRQQLNDRDDELQMFVYSVSHDLSAPLRHIDGFTKRLVRRNQDHFDEKSQQDIHFILSSVDKCQSKLAALLSYTRLKSQKKPFQEINLDALLESVLLEREEQIRALGASIVIEKLPTAAGDINQLKIFFMYLLDNSLKYYNKDRSPHIAIRVEESGEHNTFFFVDNGFGIPQKRIGEVFNVFKRAVTDDEYPGQGMGLTFCKRIITLHRGSIRIESQEGKGTSIIFTLPKE